MTRLLIGSYPPFPEQVGIYSYTMSDGTPKLTAAADGIRNPSYVLAHGDLVYAVACFSPTTCGVCTYSAERLQLLDTQTVDGKSLCHLALGNHTLYGAGYHTGSLHRFPLDAHGIPMQAQTIRYTGHGPNPDRQTMPHIHSAAADPTGRFVLIADLGADRLMSYCQHADGSLSAHPTQPVIDAPAGSGPRIVLFHPDGSRVYVICELSCEVLVYARDAAGTLRELQVISCVPENAPKHSLAAHIQLSPDGKFLYTSVRGADCIAVFPTDHSGTLCTPLFLSSHTQSPRCFAIHPSGEQIAIAGMDSGTVVLCPIDRKTGAFDEPRHTLNIPGASCVQWIGKQL